MKTRKMLFVLAAFVGAGVLIFAGFIGYQVVRNQHWGVREGTEPSMPTLSTLDGKHVSLTDYRGKVVVLDLYATWCLPCRKEIAKFRQDCWPDYADREDVVVISVAMNLGREDPEDVLKEYSAREIPWTVLVDRERELESQWEITSIPRIIVLDKSGVIRMLRLGGVEREELARCVESLTRR